MAPTAHCAAERAQYPKDRAYNDQDATDYPKDGAVENNREDEQDDAKSDQTCSSPRVEVFVSISTVPAVVSAVTPYVLGPYGALLDGSGAEIASRLDALDAERERDGEALSDDG